MSAPALSFVKIGASLALMTFLLLVVSLAVRHVRLNGEIARKTIHMSLGLYCLCFPWLFIHVWEVGLVCAGAVGLLLLARFRLPETLGAGLYRVERRSFGEIYFALAVVYLFIARELHGAGAVSADLVYVAPLLLLTVSDAAAALIGARFGRLRFNVGDGTKSLEGAAAFFLTAWLLSFAALATLTPMRVSGALGLSLAAAARGAFIEAVSWRGFDNFSVPFGASLVFAYGAPGARLELPAAFAFAFPV